MRINSNARKIISKEDIEMIEAGILTETLDLTSLGRGRLDALSFQAYKKELLAEAKEINARGKKEGRKES